MVRFRAMSAEHEPLPPLPAVHHAEIDGVPVFWADVPMPRIGALVFGVGRADERAAIGGISHLVEHLALAPLTQPEYSHNGLVAGSHAMLHASGSDDELVSFFGSVASSLASLPLERLGMERRILRQEAANRSSGIAESMLWYRFGSRSFGLLGTEELGLGWLGPDAVADWAARHFTRDNAAMWFSGPPPAGLRLDLPAGPGAPAPSLEPLPGVPFPAYLGWKADRIALSYLTERSAASVVTLEVVARRARELLRFERGLVYDVETGYERLDAATAHCLVTAACRAEDAVTVRDELVAALDAIARDGLTPDEIRRATRSFRESLAIPQAVLGFLNGQAFDQVSGRPLETFEELIAEYDALDGAAAGATLAAALGTMLLCAPGDPASGRWVPYPGWSREVLEGRTFRPPGLRLPGRKVAQELTVGDAGVTWRSADGSTLTVRYDQCVAYRHWQGDIRELWGADGFRIRILPEEWKDGVEAVRLVDAAIPPELIVCDEHGVGALEDPADHAAPGAAGAP
jgi:hypothetical protein